jgi:6,7-dimethyl-8-ribityllumazine synthase
MRPSRILILEARFYDRITDDLVRGALAELARAGCDFQRIVIPGVLELPAGIAMAVASGRQWDGFITLGCVVKGASDHYDHVCREAMRGLQDLAIRHHLALGNGILTVHDLAQAEERADPARVDIGGLTARACLRMIAARREISGEIGGEA